MHLSLNSISDISEILLIDVEYSVLIYHAFTMHHIGLRIIRHTRHNVSTTQTHTKLILN